MSLKEQIREAAQMLDREIPGWHTLVNPETLQMSSCSMCVLGQVFGIPMENKLRDILGDSCPPLHEQQVRVPEAAYLRGIKYLSDRRRSAAGFGTQGKCEWVEEIATRRAADETSNA